MGAWLYPEGLPSASQRRRVVAALVGLTVLLLSVTVSHAAGPSLETKWATTGASELALTVTVEKGWHLNANDPDRPYVIPTTLEITAPAGTTIESIRYPDAVVRSLGFAPGTPLRLYEGTFTIGVRVAGPPPVRFDATLAYQACNDETCLPPKNLAVPYQAKAGSGR